MTSATFRVPASTSNFGPGFDALGCALRIYNVVTVRRGETASGEQEEIVADAVRAFSVASGVPPEPFSWEIEGDVPRSRGLGSSVTVRLGLLAGLNALAGSPLTRGQLFALCAKLEGHPDNAAPAAFGGFTVAGGPQPMRFEVGVELQFVLLIPDFEIATPDARAVLPAMLDRLAAARSCANACRIVGAFARQDYGLLRGAFDDELHQPFREQALIPFLSDVIAAGTDAGALGGFLSGSGSTICCLTCDTANEVAEAMRAAAPPGARTLITAADNAGMHELSDDA